MSSRSSAFYKNIPLCVLMYWMHKYFYMRVGELCLFVYIKMYAYNGMYDYNRDGYAYKGSDLRVYTAAAIPVHVRVVYGHPPPFVTGDSGLFVGGGCVRAYWTGWTDESSCMHASPVCMHVSNHRQSIPHISLGSGLSRLNVCSSCAPYHKTFSYQRISRSLGEVHTQTQRSDKVLAAVDGGRQSRCRSASFACLTSVRT